MDISLEYLSAFLGMYALGFICGITIHAFKTFSEKI